MIVLTGDTHGAMQMGRIEKFCREHKTTRKDVIIVLGDAGFNFFLDERDETLKQAASSWPVTIFCVHGNHEERPCSVRGYETVKWHGGTAWGQRKYPGLLFAEDGEIYDFGGRKAIAIGGAYSVDKHFRLANHWPWFPSEQPDEKIRARVEAALDRVDWQVDYVFSHTVPRDFIPVDAFPSKMDWSGIDLSTECWLQRIADRLHYEQWFAGHFHVAWNTGRVHILYENFERLGES